MEIDRPPGGFHHVLYYPARKIVYTVPALLHVWGRPSPWHTADRNGLALPPDPHREGRAAAPRRALPRAVRFRVESRLFYAPHSNPGADRRSQS